MSYAELDTIRTSGPLTVTDDGTTHHIPAGTEGTVVYVHDRAAAYEVEFVLAPGSYGPNDEILDYPVECLATLTPDQITERAPDA
ncbi:DUF4926 domain-containing protein [Desulfovibrio psychrotolerans]|uniref:DUF4926 domain-containing protein n=1 Tax=Desulfovibrio psychrotolerans TaxID=415242 RepID=A0A7J0BXT7_9BACT|nr:DUF4926 domain-containing protein [Desulfovibrio psychrotolerans]GFM37991.1 hypothetical protein DSM19430T_26750 [Desulfovibrio psychrotolerans]